jgi:hypothetical protein
MNAVVEVKPSEVVEAEPHAVIAANPLDVAPEMFRNALARRGENRKALMTWIRESLVRGTDYGRIHVVGKDKCREGNACTNERHFSKDCLFKPGAEKIAGMLGVTPTFPTLPQYEEAALKGVELKQIILRCHMVDSGGRIVADGIGARSLEQDYGDINKSLKMCAKSAHIDATLRMAGLSEVFTQDLDQMQVDGKLGSVDPAPTAPALDPSVVPQGKHKGKKWVEVSNDYLGWAVNADRCPPALKAACKAEMERRVKAMTDGIDEDLPREVTETEAGVRG